MYQEKIDFVVTWVDNNDEQWLEKKRKFKLGEESSNNSSVRYRDWDLLKFWFRAVEQHAPWVNNIYLVVDNQIPNWIDTSNKKINIVNHSDFIPKEYLPTFNSRAIELNLHRIEGLSEKFVYFNDDMFLNQSVTPNDFFCDDLPVDIGALNLNVPNGTKMSPVLFNNLEIINKNFSQRKLLKRNFGKYLNINYGLLNLRTIYLLPIPFFVGFYNPHLPISFVKRSFDDVWNINRDVCDFTCSFKFRESLGINLWLMRYWQLASGKFKPQKRNFGKYLELCDENIEKVSFLLKSSYSVICINDTDKVKEFEDGKKTVRDFFYTKYSNKSTFER
ncbi:Stealth CR1 domain-containing protein [Enterococcus gallinarum]|uniref:Stealth CR1 domain-containing protein n=1 Tax=Enterococcus gallinarum TaxID=1353 RepID=UPI003D6A115C